MMKKYFLIACLAVLIAIAGLVARPTHPVQREAESGDSDVAPMSEVPSEPDGVEADSESDSRTPSILQPVPAAPRLLHDVERRGTAYLNAVDEVEALLNGFRTGRVVIRSRIVEVDEEYASRVIRGVMRDIDALSGRFEGALSETLDIAIFSDTPCTLSYFASGFRGPRVRSIETSPQVFAIVEDEAGGEVVLLRSHCGSTRTITSAEVQIDTFEETVNVKLANDRVVQQLISLDTEKLMLAVEFDAMSFPRRNEHVD